MFHKMAGMGNFYGNKKCNVTAHCGPNVIGSPSLTDIGLIQTLPMPPSPPAPPPSNVGLFIWISENRKTCVTSY